MTNKKEPKYNVFSFTKYLVLTITLSLPAGLLFFYYFDKQIIEIPDPYISINNILFSFFILNFIILLIIFIFYAISSFNNKKLIYKQNELLKSFSSKEQELSHQKDFLEEEKNVFIEIQKNKLQTLQSKYEMEYHKLKKIITELNYKNKEYENQINNTGSSASVDINFEKFNRILNGIDCNINILKDIIKYNSDIKLFNNLSEYENVISSSLNSSKKNIIIFYPNNDFKKLNDLIQDNNNTYTIIWTNYYEQEIIDFITHLKSNNITNVKIGYLNQPDFDFFIIENEYIIFNYYKKNNYKIYYFNKSGVNKICNELISDNRISYFKTNTDILNETIKKENFLLLKFSSNDYIIESDKINIFFNYLEENKNEYIPFISLNANNTNYFVSLLQKDLFTVPF